MKRDYFSRLSLWARWYLSKKEAAEVLEDYREIIDGRSEEELRRDIGRPKDAVCCLVQPAVYQRWLKVFAVLSVAVLIPAVSPSGFYRFCGSGRMEGERPRFQRLYCCGCLCRRLAWFGRGTLLRRRYIN